MKPPVKTDQSSYEDEGRSILTTTVLVICDAQVQHDQIVLRTFVNGDNRRLILPMDSSGLRIVTHLHRNLEEHLIKCVERLHLKSYKNPELGDVKQKRKFSSARIGFIKRCLKCIADLRKQEGATITQRAVAQLLYGPLRSGGSDRDAQFSQDLRRKKISFSKLIGAGKRWEELTPDEMIRLLKET